MAGFRMPAGWTDQIEKLPQRSFSPWPSGRRTRVVVRIGGRMRGPRRRARAHGLAIVQDNLKHRPHSLKARSRFLAPEKAFSCAASIRADVRSVRLKFV